MEFAMVFHLTGIDGAKEEGRNAEVRARTKAAEPVERITHVVVRIAGLPYRNKDGTDRMNILAKCEQYEQVVVIPEPDHPYDAHALKICRQTGEQIGYVSKFAVPEIIAKVTKGYKYYSFLYKQRQGLQPDQNKLLLLIGKPDVVLNEVQTYLDRLTESDA
jgi:hypothetical protein